MIKTTKLVGALLAVVLLFAPAWALDTTVTKTVTVNTSAADFAVITPGTAQTIRITHIDAQNVGTGAKVTFQICDGACGTATSKIGPFELSPATVSSMGGGYTFLCSGAVCEWNITPGNTVYAQVDSGATNNVRVHVTYHLYQR